MQTRQTAAMLDADGRLLSQPLDGVECNSRYLYVRVAAISSIAVFRINADGSLTPIPSLTGTPAGLAGLAAY